MKESACRWCFAIEKQVCLLPAKKQVDDSALNLSEKGFGSSFLANWRFGKNQK